jgi:hypothetical protein
MEQHWQLLCEKCNMPTQLLTLHSAVVYDDKPSSSMLKTLARPVLRHFMDRSFRPNVPLLQTVPPVAGGAVPQYVEWQFTNETKFLVDNSGAKTGAFGSVYRYAFLLRRNFTTSHEDGLLTSVRLGPQGHRFPEHCRYCEGSDSSE